MVWKIIPLSTIRQDSKDQVPEALHLGYHQSGRTPANIALENRRKKPIQRGFCTMIHLLNMVIFSSYVHYQRLILIIFSALG